MRTARSRLHMLRQLDRMPRFRHKRTNILYAIIIVLSFWMRGLKTYSVFDFEILRSRNLARTSRDYLGIVSRDTRPGDSIAKCIGGKGPLILRGHDAGVVRLIGDTYVHGMMNEEEYSEECCHKITNSLTFSAPQETPHTSLNIGPHWIRIIR
jgi:hypothetical protein